MVSVHPSLPLPLCVFREGSYSSAVYNNLFDNSPTFKKAVKEWDMLKSSAPSTTEPFGFSSAEAMAAAASTAQQTGAIPSISRHAVSQIAQEMVVEALQTMMYPKLLDLSQISALHLSERRNVSGRRRRIKPAMHKYRWDRPGPVWYFRVVSCCLALLKSNC